MILKITVDEGNTAYASVSGVLYDKGMTKLVWYPKNREHHTYTIPSTVSSIGEHALSYCVNLERFAVEAGNPHFYADDNGILYDFYREVLIAYPSDRKYIDPPILDSVQGFGDGSFAGTGLESIVIPDHVTNLGGGRVRVLVQ